MPLRLRFAPSADALLPPFLTALRERWRDPFASPVVLVPNPALGRWLDLRICDWPDSGIGSLMGFGRTTLERFLWDSLSPDSGVERLDAFGLQQVLCAQLHDNLCQDPDFAPVKQYLLGADGHVDPLRRVQLSARLARMFQEYEFNRPSVWDPDSKSWRSRGMDACWLAGVSYFQGNSFDTSLLAHERWQARLYRDAIAALPQRLSLPHLHRQRHPEDATTAWQLPPTTIFLFQVAKISHFHRNTLLEISQMPGVELQVFLTNPCAEFWEDVDTWRSHKRRQRWRFDSSRVDAGISPRQPSDYGQSSLEGIAPQPQDPPLLALWGHTGKENIYLWCPTAEWDFVYYGDVPDERPSTLLQALQHSLLRRESTLPPGPDGSRCAADGSLQILTAPDPLREVEELRLRILGCLRDGVVQHLEEVVVYLTEPARYLGAIEEVFGAYPHGHPERIPYSLLGLPGSASRFVQGTLAFLEIVKGRFDRAQVFLFLRNPLVMESQAIQPQDIAVWEAWASDLGIFRGMDREHRICMGDAEGYATDAHTFGLGFARLLAGNLATDSIDLGYGAPLSIYRDFQSSNADQLARFVDTVQRLFVDTNALVHALETEGIAAAVTLLQTVVHSWLGEVPDSLGTAQGAEAKVRKDFLAALPSIAFQESAVDRKTLPRDEFLALVQSALPDSLSLPGKAWVDGVSFAPLRQGLILPHTAVFVLGLDADAFPGSARQAPFDLLSHRRILGDSDPVRDNRFTFLEVLHAARARLTLSFQAHDMQKDEERQPSSVILELEEFLRTQGVPDLRVPIPWVAWESPGREASLDPETDILRGLAVQPRHQLRYPQIPARAPAVRSDGDTPLRTSLYALQTFFRNPLEYHLRNPLGIDGEDMADTLVASDEPLASDRSTSSSLQKEIWAAVLRRIFPWDTPSDTVDVRRLSEWALEFANEAYLRAHLLGNTPEGQLAGLELGALLEWTRRCVQATLTLAGSGQFPDHRFLSAPDFSLGIPDAPSVLTLDLGGHRTAEVRGRQEAALIPRSGAGCIGLLGFAGAGKARANDKLWLAGVLQQLVSQSHPDIALVQLSRTTAKPWPAVDFCRMLSWHGNESVWARLEGWLCDILCDMLLNGSAEHLPFAEVQALVSGSSDRSPDWQILDADTLQEHMESDFPSYSCWLPAFQLIEARVPDLPKADLVNLARSRFAPMLEGMVHG